MKRCNQVFALALAAAAVCCQAATAQPKADRYYEIEHKYSGKLVCTETGNGNPLHLWGPIPEGHQDRYAFKLVESGEDGCFYLIHKFSGKYVCAGADDGAAVHLWGPVAEGDEDKFKFKLINAAEGYYYLLHKLSGKYVYSASPENGGKFVLSPGPI